MFYRIFNRTTSTNDTYHLCIGIRIKATHVIALPQFSFIVTNRPVRIFCIQRLFLYHTDSSLVTTTEYVTVNDTLLNVDSGLLRSLSIVTTTINVTEDLYECAVTCDIDSGVTHNLSHVRTACRALTRTEDVMLEYTTTDINLDVTYDTSITSVVVTCNTVRKVIDIILICHIERS